MTQERAQLLSGAIGMGAAAAVALTGIWAGLRMWAIAPAGAAIWFVLLTILTMTAYVSATALAIRLLAPMSAGGPVNGSHTGSPRRPSGSPGRSSRARR